jgi:hypothetical protein
MKITSILSAAVLAISTLTGAACKNSSSSPALTDQEVAAALLSIRQTASDIVNQCENTWWQGQRTPGGSRYCIIAPTHNPIYSQEYTSANGIATFTQATIARKEEKIQEQSIGIGLTENREISEEGLVTNDIIVAATMDGIRLELDTLLPMPFIPPNYFSSSCSLHLPGKPPRELYGLAEKRACIQTMREVDEALRRLFSLKDEELKRSRLLYMYRRIYNTPAK